MSTWGAIVWFELRYYAKRMSTHVYFGIFFALAVIQLAGQGGLFPGVPAQGFDGPNTHLDSPFAFGILSVAFSLFATIVVAAVAGHSAQRDFGDNMHPLVHSTPVPKAVLLSARALSAWIVSMYVCGGIAAGLLAGLLLPLDPDFLGSFRLSNLLVPYLVYVGPNVVLTTALFFVIAGVTRRMFPNYIGGIGLLIGYLAASTLAADLDNKTLASLLDPFGLEALQQQTRYWTPLEKNTLALWPGPLVLANRALWMTVGLAVLVFGSTAIRFAADGFRPLERFQRARPVAVDPVVVPGSVVVPTVRRSHGAAASWTQYVALTRRAVREVLGNRYFFAIVGGGVFFLLLQAGQVGSAFGTSTWPVTQEVLRAFRGAFGLFLIIVITFYAGDLVWRERDLRVAEVVDSSPVPTLVPLAAKLTALVGVLLALQGVVLVAGLLTQLWAGYTHFELGLYLQTLYGLDLLEWLALIVLAVAVHTVVNHKYLGHFVMILFFVGRGFRGVAGFEHNLPWYGMDPGLTYSDLNGWGGYLFGFLVFKAYWLAWGGVLLVFSALTVVRGTEASLPVRWRAFRSRLGALSAAALGGFTAVAVGLGAFLLYNINVLNDYRPSERQLDRVADYEKAYKADWDGVDQPRITAVDVAVDLFPRSGALEATAELSLVNPHDHAITTLFVSRPVDPGFEVRVLDPGMPVSAARVDAVAGVHLFDLQTPMAPGQTATMSYAIRRASRGIRNQGAETTVVDNGSFVHSGLFLPTIGYSRNSELPDKHDRSRRELPERPRMADLDDAVAAQNNYLAHDADWVDFRAVVSTDPDQIAIAPGTLVREWEADGRRYFETRMQSKILHFTSVLSARYDVTRGEWEGLPIEVYHHPDHTFNVQRMIESVQDSLSYYTANFSPYQHQQVRIIEFPRYAAFAQSFPNTIPYSEGFGFIARIEDTDEDIDTVYYVTAHEIAHQWWAHQLVGGAVQGATVLSETLSQYSALMVMEEAYGEDQIRRFLEYELDSYLRGRALEVRQELPLLRVENQQYVHYNKGSLVMYRLKDELGADVVNAALARLLERFAFAGPPYPTSRDLLAELSMVTPPELGDLLGDLFERITLYDNRTEAATWFAVEDGRYIVTLDVHARKVFVDGDGVEQPAPMAERVDVGVFAGTEDDPETLYLAKHIVGDNTDRITIVVDRQPSRAGVDPWHKLIDRDSDDNMVAVAEADEDPGGAPSPPAAALVSVVTGAAAAAWAPEGVGVVLDVRTPAEFAAGHIAGAVNVDIKRPDFEQAVLALDPAVPVMVHCQAGVPAGRGRTAIEVLQGAGFADVTHLEGGYAGWVQAGLPVVTLDED